jgi:hypothetical protein
VSLLAVDSEASSDARSITIASSAGGRVHRVRTGVRPPCSDSKLCCRFAVTYRLDNAAGSRRSRDTNSASILETISSERVQYATGEHKHRFAVDRRAGKGAVQNGL